MNATAFPAHIESVGRRLETVSFSGAMEECHAQAMDGEREIFRNQMSPEGEVWPSRAARSGSSNHPLLNLSGALMAAATGGAGSVREVGDRYCVFGVRKAGSGSLAGAAVHQYGATIRPRFKKFLSWVADGVRHFAKQVTIPRRKYIGLSQEKKEVCREIIAQEGREKVFGR